MRRLTVIDLIAEVRSVLDEDNQAAVKDVEDIIPALNRGQDICSNILARHYECPLLTYQSVTLTDGTAEYDIPDDALEQRLEKLEINVGGAYLPVKRISYRDVTAYEGPSTSSTPTHYAVIGNQYRLLPTPSGTYPARLWYLKDPAALVKPQGRITRIVAASNYLTVDAIGSDLTTEGDQLNSYVNVIDGDTGAVKATLQIQSISGNRITFRSSVSRSLVLGRTVSTSLTDAAVLQDDYVCTVSGTCIPVLKKPFANYLIQYAVAELQRKLGGPADMELRVLKELEAAVEHSWVGRESTLRVQKRNPIWSTATRRLFGSNS